jgi:hypothetical protein
MGKSWKLLQQKKFRSPRYLLPWLAVGTGVLLVAGGLSYALWPDKPKTAGDTHGPRVSDLAAQITVEEQQPTPAPVSASSLVPLASAAAPATAQKNIGIAAGGILTAMSQAALNQYTAEVKALGVQWVRWDIEWLTVQEGGPSSYDWSGADRVVNTLKSAGINSVVVLAYAPAWARQGVCVGDDKCAPANPDDYARFARQAAARYAPQGVHHWEIWNEPNYVNFWQPAPDAVAYTALLKAAYGQVKAVDPGAVVLSGGLAAAANEDGNVAPTDFVRTMYQQGAKGALDGLALHPYSYPVVPDYKASWNFWQQMSTIHSVMEQSGDGHKIWITEFGAPTGGPGTARTVSQLEFNYPHDYMTEAAQNDIASNALGLYKQNASWLDGFFWYNLKDNGTSSSTAENFFGLLRYDGSKKPAYATFQNAIKQ